MKGFIALLLWTLTGAAQTVAVRGNFPLEVGGANLPAQKIGPNDLIAVSVYDAPELTRTIRVSADGMIRLPMVRQRLKASGLLPPELEAAIADALREEQILVEPVVTVTMVEYHSRPINVAGAVRKPVTFQAVGPTTLLDAIAKAEGLTPDAGPEILVSRSQPADAGGQTTLTQRILVSGLIDEADPELNVRLVGGEQIRVPEVGKIFVVGNVRRPGAFPVHDAAGASVLKILALSEGLMPFSAKVGYIYRKEGAGNGKNEIPIEIQKIIDRKMADVPLQANDILYIPDNKTRRLTVTTLERLAGFGSATASGILIWRR
ncbi:MAG: polysaccharide biosynthesis/export family protein [Bryobacterales bacterium]|nr:polysaccharide biosynthesis/export family protein [Bryobacterales bacterium]